jgi:uncharacterized small protein (DUF1192 family)
MDLDDLMPKKTTGLASLQEDLARFSIEDLDERIKALEAEIERCRAAKKAKQSTLAAAQSFFKR